MLVVSLHSSTKRLCLRSFAGILFSVCHLLQELLSLLVVGKGETSNTILDLEAVKEDSVLAVTPLLVDFLVPEDTSRGWLGRVVSKWGMIEHELCTYRNINQFYPVGVSYQVIREHYSSLQAGVCPF